MDAEKIDDRTPLVAPIIIGSGRASFVLPEIERAEQALRGPMRAHPVGDEVLLVFEQ